MKIKILSPDQYARKIHEIARGSHKVRVIIKYEFVALFIKKGVDKYEKKPKKES